MRCAYGFMAALLAGALARSFAADWTDLMVAADGTGDFKTIQAALDSIPATNAERKIILIRNGVYKEKIRIDASCVTLRGQSRQGTRIEYPQLNDDFVKKPDPLGRAVVNINRADDVVLEHLTAVNTAGVVGPHAFTVHGSGDRTVILDCDLLSHGADTVALWLSGRGRYYHAGCRFQGSVDFVCPRGWCYITNCSFYEMKQTAALWHDGSHDQDMKFVLRNCQLDGVEGWTLARHHIDAQFYLLECAFSKSMTNKPPARVIYPDDPQRNADLDRSNKWGERAYFYHCHRDGGDFPWFQDNLDSATNSPTADQITAAWTFAGSWNPEARFGTALQSVTPQKTVVTLGFKEAVTVKGKPRVALKNGSFADYVSGSGTRTLTFSMPAESAAEVASVELNGASIVASEAGVSVRPARLDLPKRVELK